MENDKLITAVRQGTFQSKDDQFVGQFCGVIKTKILIVFHYTWSLKDAAPLIFYKFNQASLFQKWNLLNHLNLWYFKYTRKLSLLFIQTDTIFNDFKGACFQPPDLGFHFLSLCHIHLFHLLFSLHHQFSFLLVLWCEYHLLL